MLHPRTDYNERIQDNKNLIPANEPVFLLRAQDQLATGALRQYAFLLHRHGKEDEANQVYAWVEKFIEWQNDKTVKLPDTPKQLQLLLTK